LNSGAKELGIGKPRPQKSNIVAKEGEITKKTDLEITEKD